MTGPGGRRWPAALCASLVVALLALALTACGKGSGAAINPAPELQPEFIVPAPAGALSAAAPAANGLMWVLAGNGSVQTLRQIDLRTRTDQAAAPAPKGAVAIAESATGLLGVGLATASTGALELCNGESASPLAAVAVGAPVRSVAAGDNGGEFYVLDGGVASASVTVVDGSGDQIQETVPVARNAVAAVPDPGQDALWVLQPNGVVDEVALAGGKITTQFTIGYSGRALALSPDGNTLYVLKGRGSIRNVAVVDLATEIVRRVLPAPADAVGLVLSPDGSTLYDFVGTPTAGNIQAFSVGS